MRSLILLLTISSLGLSQAPVLSPSAPRVVVGGSVTITSNVPVTFTLPPAAPGTCTGCGVAGVTSATYTAPATKAPKHVISGCQVMPDDNIFYQRIDDPNFPLVANYSTMIDRPGTNTSTLTFHFSPNWGISVATASTPTVSIKGVYSAYTTTGVPAPRDQWSFPEGGIYGTGKEGDVHQMIINHDDCTFSDTYAYRWDGGTFTCNNASTGCNASSAVKYDWSTYSSYPSGDGTTAAGTPLLPLQPTLSELKAGAINHAIQFTTPNGYIGSTIASTPVWPALNSNGSGNSAAMPMGSRLRMASTFDATTVCGTGTSTAAQYCNVFITQMKQYGLMLVDGGSGNEIIANADLCTDPDAVSAMNMIAAGNIALNPTNFQIVDLSGLRVSNSAADFYKVKPASYTAGVYAPANQVVLKATTAGGASSSVYVAVQGVAIGCGHTPSIQLVAGSYPTGWTPYCWVTPTSKSQKINWTLLSGPGSIVNGVYYPPTDAANNTGVAQLHGVALADSNATFDFTLHIWPAGAVRLACALGNDFGHPTSASDKFGNLWYDGRFGMPYAAVAYNFSSVEYPSNTNNISPVGGVMNGYLYTYSTDLRYDFVVPNGKYQVTFYMRSHRECNSFFCGTFNLSDQRSRWSTSPVRIEVNGKTYFHRWDWLADMKFVLGVITPEGIQSVTAPVTVTDNTLIPINRIFSLFSPDATGNIYVATSNGAKGSRLDGLTIIPDTVTAAHWELDNQDQTTITYGSTLLPFYVIDWFTNDGDTSSPQWTVSGPPGITIDQDGVVSWTSGLNYPFRTAVVVKATGANHSASYTLYTTGANWAFNPKPLAAKYQYVRSITVDHTKVGGAVNNFPVLVTITDPTLKTVANGGHVQSANGNDIVFSSTNTGIPTLIPWEVETYDGTLGKLVAHVALPTLGTITDTPFYLYYGNVSTAAGAQNFGLKVWDNNYTSVFHFGSLSANSTPNSITTGSPATVGNFTSSSTNAIAGASLNITSQFPTAVDSAASAFSQGTIEVWAKPTVASGNDSAIVRGYGGTNSEGFWMFMNPSIYGVYNLSNAVTGWHINGTNYQCNTGDYPLNVWHHFVFTWNFAAATKGTAYLDGQKVCSITTGPAATYVPTSAMNLFGLLNYNYQGYLDETRFSNIVRSQEYMQTEYASYGSPSTFYTLGSETPNN